MTQDHKEKYPLYSPWKCRDGTKAVIVEHCDDYMIVYREDGNNTWEYEFDGKFRGGDYKEHDLIEPWKDPRTIEGWVNVYDDGDGFYFSTTFEKYMSVGEQERAIKTIKISYTEGE